MDQPSGHLLKSEKKKIGLSQANEPDNDRSLYPEDLFFDNDRHKSILHEHFHALCVAKCLTYHANANVRKRNYLQHLTLDSVPFVDRSDIPPLHDTAQPSDSSQVSPDRSFASELGNIDATGTRQIDRVLESTTTWNGERNDRRKQIGAPTISTVAMGFDQRTLANTHGDQQQSIRRPLFSPTDGFRHALPLHPTPSGHERPSSHVSDTVSIARPSSDESRHEDMRLDLQEQQDEPGTKSTGDVQHSNKRSNPEVDGYHSTAARKRPCARLMSFDDCEDQDEPCEDSDTQSLIVKLRLPVSSSGPSTDRPAASERLRLRDSTDGPVDSSHIEPELNPYDGTSRPGRWVDHRVLSTSHSGRDEISEPSLPCSTQRYEVRQRRDKEIRSNSRRRNSDTLTYQSEDVDSDEEISGDEAEPPEGSPESAALLEEPKPGSPITSIATPVCEATAMAKSPSLPDPANARPRSPVRAAQISGVATERRDSARGDTNRLASHSLDGEPPVIPGPTQKTILSQITFVASFANVNLRKILQLDGSESIENFFGHLNERRPREWHNSDPARYAQGVDLHHVNVSDSDEGVADVSLQIALSDGSKAMDFVWKKMSGLVRRNPDTELEVRVAVW